MKNHLNEKEKSWKDDFVIKPAFVVAYRHLGQDWTPVCVWMMLHLSFCLVTFGAYLNHLAYECTQKCLKNPGRISPQFPHYRTLPIVRLSVPGQSLVGRVLLEYKMREPDKSKKTVSFTALASLAVWDMNTDRGCCYHNKQQLAYCCAFLEYCWRLRKLLLFGKHSSFDVVFVGNIVRRIQCYQYMVLLLLLLLSVFYNVSYSLML